MRKLKILFLFLTVFSLLATTSSFSATTEVSQPVKLTDSDYYERGQSIVYDGSDYFLFYGRSASCADPYSSGDPDINDYEIYFKKANSMSGLASATATRVTGTHNTSLYMGETDAAIFDGKVWVFGSYDAGTAFDLYAWYSSDGGSTWTEYGAVATGLPDGSAHFAATTCSGNLWIAYKQGGDWKSKNYDGSSWSSEYHITTNSGTAKFYVEGTSLYFVRADSGDQDIHQWGGSAWSQLDSATESGPYDPTIYKVGSNYVLAYAPWVSPKQWIKAKVGTSISTLLSAGTEVIISGAEYAGNTWIDMWPVGFSDGTSNYLLMTSERNPDNASSKISGNIWYLEVDWEVTRDHYTYIQPAIDAATAGDVVEVAAGTYQENMATWKDMEITKSLSLIGAGSGSTVIWLSEGQMNGIEIRGTSMDVTLEGLTFTRNPSSSYASSFNLRIGETTSDFNSLILRDVESAYAKGRNVYIDGNGTYDNITIENCSFHNSGAWGLSARGTINTMTITDSDFEYNGSDDPDHGIGFDIDMPHSVSSLTVTGGSFSNNQAKGINLVKTNNATFTGVTANNNSGASGGGFGICLWEWDSASSNITFTECTTSNNSTDGFLFGTQDTYTITDVEITNCFANGNGRYGVFFYHGNGSASGITVAENDLSGNTGGALGTTALGSVIDAYGNWFGSSDHATVASLVGAEVDYTPWLASGTDTGDPGFQGDFSELWVDDDSPQTGTKGRVQEGVDLLSGSSLNLAPGTYEEQVEITKDLTLSGDDTDNTACVILSPDNLTKYFTTSNDNYPVVYIHDTDNVTLEYLTVDGAGKGNANYSFQGVCYHNAGGTVDNCVITGVIDTPFSGTQHGVALYAWNADGNSRNLNVWDCTFTDFQKNAMALNANATTPLVVDVKGNTVTGAGTTDVTAQNGVQVWGDLATGTVENNTVSGIAFSGGGWVATSILNYYAQLDIIDNTVTGSHMGIYNYDGEGTINYNDVTAEKIGGYCWAICASDPPRAVPAPFGDEELAAGPEGMLKAPLATLDVDVIGNTVTFQGPDNSGTYGIEADAGYGPDDLDVTINYNTVCGFEAGIEIWKCTSGCDTGVFTSVVANYNYIGCGNIYGMRSNADYITANGENNWWGDASGPSGVGPGTGTQVSDYIDYDPWMGEENVASVVPVYGTTNCTDPISYTFHIDQAGAGEEVRGYNVTFSVDNSVVTVAAPNSDITEDDYLSSVNSTQFYVTDEGGGSYSVSCAILGGETGATGSGDLFTVLLTPVAAGVSDISITDIALRDLDNNDLPISGIGGSVRIDCTVPTMEAIAEAEGGWYNTAPVFSNFGFDDDINLDTAEYQIDAGGWNTLFSGIDAAEWNDDGWTLPGFSGLSEGSHTVYFRVADDAGNWNGEGTPDTYSWQFNKDTTPPDPPTGFTAEPGNNKVHLSWTNPTGDATFAGVELRRVAWGDYPEYITAPDYPADETEGVFVDQTAAEAHDDSITAGRDIYYFAGFSYDLAGNYSSYSADASDRATSYWLGDVHSPYDGMVNSTDLVDFSSAFGESDGDPGWNNECDFGPTDDISSYGIPLPDDVVDFEDLMIFAMIYGKVDPLGANLLAAAGGSREDFEKLVEFEITPASDSDAQEGYTILSVRLSNEAKSMKGFRLSLETDRNDIVSITRGGMFKNNSNLFFGTTEGTDSPAEICVAALGIGLPVKSSGEVARITLKAGEDVSLRINEIEIRDINNESHKLEVEEDYSPSFTPKANALLQNYPNPFNPQTTITFDIVNAERVSIDIYDVNGRLVRNLLNERRSGGRHSIQWNGLNNSDSTVPSGIYFYRITAGNFNATRKMILLR
ncbi:MAG: T9SS type A sorting domain-containing protein [Candidatus Krumholzibacteriales bacterium]